MYYVLLMHACYVSSSDVLTSSAFTVEQPFSSQSVQTCVGWCFMCRTKHLLQSSKLQESQKPLQR